MCDQSTETDAAFFPPGIVLLHKITHILKAVINFCNSLKFLRYTLFTENNLNAHFWILLYTNITVTFTRTLTNVYAAFGSDVEFECAISDHMADCEWYKDGILVEDGVVARDRNKHWLQLFSISHDDEGDYECRCGNESTKATLGVKGICWRNI